MSSPPTICCLTIDSDLRRNTAADRISGDASAVLSMPAGANEMPQIMS